MWEYDFMQNAFIAGTIIAFICGIISYFVIVRRIAFAAHALGHISLTGAAGAAIIGLSPMSGLLTLNIISAIIMGLIGDRIRKSDMAVGIVLTFFLGIGAYFLYLYQTGYAGSIMAIMFGDILSVSSRQIFIIVILTSIVLISLLIIMRPLLFSSIDPTIASSKRIPSEALSIYFLILLAITVSMACQIVGALLIFALLVGPGAAASECCDGFYSSLSVSIGVSILSVWLSLLISFYANLPTSFCITMLISFFYIISLFIKRLRMRHV
ncbi:MAG TPA: ABC transporter permease [Lentisphaeria bacterium]|nr:MAG: ABC transporter permease [Lentisphaerae bacterium GWF2_38_69]HBM16309.1 ABC transporter permease [Lentisphaeria bacterium]